MPPPPALFAFLSIGGGGGGAHLRLSHSSTDNVSSRPDCELNYASLHDFIGFELDSAS